MVATGELHVHMLPHLPLVLPWTYHTSFCHHAYLCLAVLDMLRLVHALNHSFRLEASIK